jgi:NAD(P)-dependent dehydrogenase (short-subunit alcohol dehydrogenase family)
VDWDPRRLPNASDSTIVITGANAGIGFFVAAQLAGAGARIVLACRDESRAQAAMAAIRARVPGASLSFLSLDTSDLDSVRAAADGILSLERVDVLIENAGMVHAPRERAADAAGNELVLSTNLLGHFALTALVMPVLRATPGSRIVLLGSLISRLYDFRIGDLQLRAHYSAARAYAHSKIGMQSFGFELDRRLRVAAAGPAAIVAHPGYSISGLTATIPGVNEPSAGTRLVDALQAPMAQSKERGAWPIVRAAIDPEVQGGQYWGPRLVTRGRPVLQSPTHGSTDPAVAAELWAKLEEYTGVPFDV